MKVAACMDTGQVRSTLEVGFIDMRGINLPQVRERRGGMQALGGATRWLFCNGEYVINVAEKAETVGTNLSKAAHVEREEWNK
jgi:hypothetical protein